MKVFDIRMPVPQGPAQRDQQAFLMGTNFHEAALRAGIENHDTDGIPIAAVCPMLVCYAFAAELYLKSLSPRQIRNHRLNVLYTNLDSDTRRQVALFYQSRTNREPDILERDLRLFATTFEDWRYVYEGDGQQVRANLLIAFTKAVYETARTLRPHWNISQCRHQRLIADELTPTVTVANLGGGTFIHVVDHADGILNLPSAQSTSCDDTNL